MGTVTTRPQFLNANTNVYTAWDLRHDGEVPPGEGVAGYEDFRVIQRIAGANMSVDIGNGSILQRAWVRGDTRGGQGLYAVDSIDRSAPTASTYVAQLNEAVTANSSGNPRLDMVVLEVLDAQHSGSSNLARIRVVAGTPNAAATLDTRTGAATLPDNCLHLADVIVANGAASIATADIRDRRPRCIRGDAPFPGWSGGVPGDVVGMEPHQLHVVSHFANVTHNTDDGRQVAALMYLPRRIVSATRIRWRYVQGGTANTGNYVIAIYDASGRLIVDTGSVAFTGAANTLQARTETITATTFDAGAYFVLFGCNTATAGGSSNFIGVLAGVETTMASTASLGAVAPNILGGRTSGDITPPTTLTSMGGDLYAQAIAFAAPDVPLIGLSVG
jgi:hypothetical protein